MIKSNETLNTNTLFKCYTYIYILKQKKDLFGALKKPQTDVVSEACWSTA